MINDGYDLVIGIYLGIILFFAGYKLLSNKDSFMKDTTLNLIFMAFFIIIFFLFGFLFKNIFLQFKDVNDRNSMPFINTNAKINYEDSPLMPIES